MLEFIVCDNNKNIVSKVSNIIDSLMMKNNTNYKIRKFYDYDDEFMEKMGEIGINKVYILDIQVNDKSGIDIARKIREEDLQSAIIFLTSHSELAEYVVYNVVAPLGFINKFNNYEEKLIELLKIALKRLGTENFLKIAMAQMTYQIPIKDILYITHDSVERKCIIMTGYSDFKVNKSLTELFETLPNTFKYSHRACIVNMDRITKVEIHKMLIHFDEGTILNLFSNTYKKEIKDYVINK